MSVTSAMTRPGRRRIMLLVILWAAGLLLAVSPAPSRANEAAGDASLLLLTSYHQGYRWNDDIVASVEARFAHETATAGRFQVEYLDALRLPGHLADEALLARLQQASLDPRGSLILTDDPAMAFYLRYRDALPWPEKVVALGLNDDLLRVEAEAAGVKSLKSYPVMAQSLNMLVDTFGAPLHLILLGENTEHAYNVIDDMTEVVGSVRDVQLVDVIHGWTPEVVLERLARSPPGTRLYMQGGRDSGWNEGPGSTAERLEALARQKVPVFCHFAFQMAVGCAGGAILDIEFLAHAAVEVALTPAFELVPASSSIMAQRYLIHARWYQLFDGKEHVAFQWVGVRGRLEQLTRGYQQAVVGMVAVTLTGLLVAVMLLLSRFSSLRRRRRLMVDDRFQLPTRMALESDYQGPRCAEIEWLFLLAAPEVIRYRRRLGNMCLEALLRSSLDALSAHLPKGWRLYIGKDERIIGAIPAHVHGPDVESQLDSYLALVCKRQQAANEKVLHWYACVTLVPAHISNLNACLSALDEGMQRLEAEGWVRPILRVVAAGPYQETHLRWLCRQVGVLIEEPDTQWRLVAQPKLAPPNRSLVGVEMLIRWRHPEAGDIPPADFLPVILMLGLAERFDRWVIKQALDWLASLVAPTEWLHCVSVNVHLSSLLAEDFPDYVSQQLALRGIAPECLELELVEHENVDDVEQVQRQMLALRERGIGIALDDFGSGYTAFNLLQRLPLTSIKLDYSLLHAARRFDQARQAYAALVGLCHRMELCVVAEGVETIEDASWLVMLGVQEGQGYFFAPPMELGEVADVYGTCLQRPSSVNRLAYLVDRRG
ncbi:EAL domain-containing protein [Halomonas cupida]|uniref:EAL domain-containing protein n=1 Tax=Halomonas TaxID=2745 RepID=UPI001A90AD59|nr:MULTISPECIES: EAL domain-containing protein [Halomonas]MBN8411334.1 EAL domain-containing protein [Halomonas litopenaei]MBY5985298.1 EAL domain-containing protein [Halomonas sp. DP5Y7-2]